MAVKYESNAIWVALNEIADGGIFQVYPKLLAELFLQEEAARREGDFSEAEKLVLPSDKEYRLTQYFKLVALQKTLETEDEIENIENPAEEPPEEWAPWALVLPFKNPHAPPPVAVNTTPGPAWDIEQVVKAARLLCKPPMPVDFVDEQDMRCVYSLIYDVFRYKCVLEQALQDTEFFIDHPEYTAHRHTIWLFLMELARRRWGARPRKELERAERLLSEAGELFKDMEKVVWEQRVHFAAAIARIRIKNKAFTLSELLPAHLREERCAYANKQTVTGWVNIFKAKKVALLVKKLHELGYSYSNSKQLCAGEYRFDRVCPRFITLRPPSNVSIGQIDLVKEGIIVLQEREFCEGASTLCRALRANCLQGVVAQTHASSPRCSAYLAAQLRDLAAVLKAQTPAAPATPTLGKLVVFGAGDKVESYIGALKELGIEASEAPQSGAPVLILSEPVYCETPTVVSALDGVVAVLATPPNSYSAVTDPIDLVCGRGGDLAMLEVLTESEIDSKGKTRVQLILEEQKKTLKTLMSKPQIQLILYETHSALEAENQAQVTRAVAEANRLARERHMWIKKKFRIQSPKKHAVIAEIDTITNASTTSFESILPSEFDKDCPLEDVSLCDSQSTIQTISSSRPSSAAKSRSSRPSSRTTTARTKLSSSDRYSRKRQDSVDSHSRPGTTKARPIPEMPTQLMPHDPDQDNPNVIVPNCDLFEVTKLPNLGNGLDINYILDRDGCYLGLIQRKEITRLDAKYMIRVAEERGLFGHAASAPPPHRRKKEPVTLSPKRRRRKQSFEVERVGAPTYASMSRSMRRGSAPGWLEPAADARRSPNDARLVCERHARRHAAAQAITAASCTCDARHKSRRTSVTVTSPRLTQPCRRPFPLVVQDLRLNKSISNHHKVNALQA